MKKWILVLLGALIACALLVFAAVVTVDVLQDASTQASNPVVDIHSPTMDDRLTTGQPLMLQAVARDPDGVQRIEFWLDDQLVKHEESPWEKGITPLPLAHSLRIDQAGQHGLVVRAFDTRGYSGQASLILEVAQGSAEPVSGNYVVQEGNTLEGIAEALGMPETDITALNPGLENELPPAGEEIVLPPSPTEEPDDGEPSPGPADVPFYDPPDILWDLPPLPRFPWVDALFDGFDPGDVPAGLLDIALLEVDGPYDGVFCYVSAGDSPAVRVPGAGFLTHLSGNFWDISEWFSGESMLPFMSTGGTVRLRMNCVGFYHTAGGGVSWNLGLVDITRSLDELGTGWVDETSTPGPARWFRIRFGVRPLGDGAGGGGTEYDYLYLTSRRFARHEHPLWPTPQVELQFRIYDEGRHVPPPVMDGFLIYRNDTLWRTSGATMETYPVWDELFEAGTCGEVTAFYVVGYQGNPLAPSATLESNHIDVTGYCPPSEELRRWVTVEFNFLKVFDVWSLDHGYWAALNTHGVAGPRCGADGEEPCDLLEVLDDEGFPSALDNWDPVSYGGLNVNDRRVIEMAGGIIQFAPQLYYFPIGPWSRYYRHSLVLRPWEALSVSTDLWDYDVGSADDPICPGTIRYSPEQLTAIMDSGATERRLVTFIHEGSCALEFQFTVEPIPAGAAPPPFVPP